MQAGRRDVPSPAATRSLDLPPADDQTHILLSGNQINTAEAHYHPHFMCTISSSSYTLMFSPFLASERLTGDETKAGGRRWGGGGGVHLHRNGREAQPHLWAYTCLIGKPSRFPGSSQICVKDTCSNLLSVPPPVCRGERQPSRGGPDRPQRASEQAALHGGLLQSHRGSPPEHPLSLRGGQTEEPQPVQRGEEPGGAPSGQRCR